MPAIRQLPGSHHLVMQCRTGSFSISQKPPHADFPSFVAGVRISSGVGAANDPFVALPFSLRRLLAGLDMIDDRFADGMRRSLEGATKEDNLSRGECLQRRRNFHARSRPMVQQADIMCTFEQSDDDDEHSNGKLRPASMCLIVLRSVCRAMAVILRTMAHGGRKKGVAGVSRPVLGGPAAPSRSI